jgi:(p)ppGpp synthase/HD superfamily hydrolase
MRESPSDSDLIFHAIQFAAAAHAGQFRKGTRIPYIVHPLRVAQLLLESGCPDHVAIAGVLHDTVEDTFVSIEQIERLFGSRVAHLVEGATEPDKLETWEHRKEHTVTFLETATQEMLCVSIADKLDNIRSIHEELEVQGEEAWTRFKRPRDKQRWYYESLAAIFERRLTDPSGKRMLPPFLHEVSVVFGNHP